MEYSWWGSGTTGTVGGDVKWEVTLYAPSDDSGTGEAWLLGSGISLGCNVVLYSVSCWKMGRASGEVGVAADEVGVAGNEVGSKVSSSS